MENGVTTIKMGTGPGGWYGFQWHFRKGMNGVEIVEMTLADIVAYVNNSDRNSEFILQVDFGEEAEDESGTKKQV